MTDREGRAVQAMSEVRETNMYECGGLRVNAVYVDGFLHELYVIARGNVVGARLDYRQARELRRILMDEGAAWPRRGDDGG
jgi:hypothetical protein